MSSLANLFHLKIISPALVMVDVQVVSAEIPGLEGDFGVLPNHAAFFSMIRPGVISVQYPDGAHRRFFAASGYADVTPEGCTVISDHIQDLADISLVEAEDALRVAHQALQAAVDDVSRMKAEKIRQIAETLVAAVRA